MKIKTAGVALTIALFTFVVYIPSLGNDFVNWDDGLYVYENLYIRSLDTRLLKWAFLNFYGGNWHPLTLLSHAADYALWGLNPSGHHLTSVILHGTNTFLVILLVMQLLQGAGNIQMREGEAKGRLTDKGRLAVAAITGMLFGLHPVHVESVSWISERKDVLCAFFFLLSLVAYIRYIACRNERGAALPRVLDRRYLISLLLFILSSMSKPMAVTLPAVLLILDWYPFERFGRVTGIKYVLLEKIPFFIISLAIGVVTIMAQHSGGAVVALEELPILPRILVSFKAVVGYLWKMLYPSVLIPHYPYPRSVSIPSLEFLAPVILTVVMTVACIFVSKRRGLWMAVWGYYIMTLLPVIGIVQVGEQSMADRYTYLPSIGPFLLAGLGVVFIYNRLVYAGCAVERKVLFIAPVIFLLGGMSYKTLNQTSIWENGETLWSHEIKNEPMYAVGYTNRGDYYTEAGRYEEAMRDINRAVAMTPYSSDPYYYRGMVYMKLGSFVEAFVDFTRAISLSYSPDFRYYKDRADAFAKLGRYGEAVDDYLKAIGLSPGLPELYNNCGRAYMALGRYSEALKNYTMAIALTPIPDYKYFKDRAIAYLRLGSYADALKDFNMSEDVRKKSSAGEEKIAP